MAAARLIAIAALLFAATANAAITDIKKFLDTCPQNDPAIAKIRADFQVRRLNVLLTELPPCTEPVSAMPIQLYTDELIVYQSLRVMYHMDRGMGGHLPWTDTSLYEWMATRIGGINIEAVGPPQCCAYIGPPIEVPPPRPGEPPPIPVPPPFSYKNLAMIIPMSDATSREHDRTWYGIVHNIALYAHETRHVEGFLHASCCGLPEGCDESFDPRNLSAYGLQWWLMSLFLDGTINLGLHCSPDTRAQAMWLLDDTNYGYWNRFCSPKPPLLPVPKAPGGVCFSDRRARTIGR